MPSNEREFRTMEIRKMEKRAENDYQVEGYATTFDDPYELWRDGSYIVKEQIDRNAFDDADLSDVVFQIDHTGRVYARTRNNSLKLKTDEHGLLSSSNLGLTETSKLVYEDIAAGLYDRMSFAFTVKKDSYTEEELDDGSTIVTRTILKVGKVYDVSAVSFPANPNTDISARSKDQIDGILKKIEADRLHRAEVDVKRAEVREIINNILGVSNG